MQRVFLFIIFAVFTVGVCAQTPAPGFDLSNYGVKIEPDKRLMIVLASLEMATSQDADGKDVKLINTSLSDKGAKFREQVVADNSTLPADLRNKITMFVTAYKKRHPKLTDAEIVAPFITMAYTLTSAPELADPVITSDLPGNLLDVLDYTPLVREFYRRSTISSKLDDYVKDYRSQAEGQLSSSTRDMVSELLNYLHTRPQLTFVEKVKVETRKTNSKKATISKVELRERDRRFYVVPESLAPRGDINFLNIRDEYYLILPPDTDLSVSEGRRAFLRFVVDPIILGNAKEMEPIRNWAKPALDELRKTEPDVSPDIFLAMSRSLVAATDIRQAEYVKIQIATDQARQKVDQLAKNNPSNTTDQSSTAEIERLGCKKGNNKEHIICKKWAVSDELDKQKQSFADESAQQLYEDYQKGSVLAFYFAEQLKGVEDSGFDIASSLREMVATFDPVKESTRVVGTADARKRALAAREYRLKNPENRTVGAENPVTVRLLEIKKTIDAKDYPLANTELKQLLTQYPSEPRIYYNIGRVAGLSAASIEDPDSQAQKLLDAKVAYSNVLRTATQTTDKALISLTYVALARVYEFFNDGAYALKLYDQAINIGKVNGGGYNEAMDAKQRLLKPQ